jgi:hypothetical protein
MKAGSLIARASAAVILFLSLPAFPADSTWVAGFPWQSAIAAKRTKTVEDYFFLLPSSIVDCENNAMGLPSAEERKKLIRISDVKNGYLAFGKNSQVAVFKNRADKTDLIAIQFGRSGAGSSCGAVNSIFQFDSKSKTWISRDDLFPKGYAQKDLYTVLSDKDILPFFLLPRKGTDIEVKNENNDSTLAVLHWNGKAFVVK